MAKSKQTDSPANGAQAPVVIELTGNVKHDGKDYGAGLTLSLAADAAQALIEAGAAKLAAQPEPASATDDDHAGDDAKAE